jgi:hypothetical protein
MRPTAQDIEPIRFISLPNGEKTSWRRLASYDFVNKISQIPVSDSELLLASHHLPIAIDSVNDGLQVVAITTSRFQRSPLIGADGQWQRGYLPIALRCLPFRAALGTSEAQQLEVAVNLAEVEGSALPIFSTDGSLSPEVERLRVLLRRLEQGKRQLQRAAEKLFIADVLTPFQMARLPGTPPARSRALTADLNKLAALSNSRAAHLAKDGFLPIDLAAACIFSQRLMPKLISVATGPSQSEAAQRTDTSEPLLAALKSEVRIDGSELFSFELFDEMSRRHEDNS